VRSHAILFAATLAAFACNRPSPHPSPEGPAPAAAAPADPLDTELDRVAAVHGAPGPWAVAGYRMGKHALAELGLERGTFDLDVSHKSPHEVMFSCIADGASAATGASLGKLNLALVDGTQAELATTYRRKSNGRSITLRPTASFRARYANTPREKARELGREVLALPPDQVFETVAQN
jgi:formylmethanofuran dehydrogenase subunit E